MLVSPVRCLVNDYHFMVEIVELIDVFQIDFYCLSIFKFNFNLKPLNKKMMMECSMSNE